MNAQLSNDNFGKFYFCGICLLDHDDISCANQCCASLVESQPLPPECLAAVKPLSKAGVDYLAKPSPTSFLGKGSKMR